jgi:hypothetical protein
MKQETNEMDRFAPLIVPYVIGALEGAQAAQFERHVTACQACAHLLEQESRLEMRLHEVGTAQDLRITAPDAAGAIVPAPRGPRRIVLAAALSVMAAVAALYQARPRPVGEQGPGPQAVIRTQAAAFAVTCLDDTQRAACIEESARHGYRIEYPPALARIPRYEEMGPTAKAHGPRPLRKAQLSFD